MADDDLNFEFEAQLERKAITAGPVDNRQLVEVPPQELIGQQPGNYRKNFKKTVCTYWLRGMCMKGESCGFLHQYDVDKMPICRNLLKYGECKELDCPYKHDTEEIKECNMYKLGFCIYGPQCRFKHKPQAGPPPPIESVEAAKPLGARDINRVVNSVNPGVLEDNRARARFWQNDNMAGLPPNKRPRALPWNDLPSNQHNQQPPLALPAPPPGNPPPQGPPGGGNNNAIPGPRPPPGGPRPPSHPPPPQINSGSGPKPPTGPPPDGNNQTQGPGQQQQLSSNSVQQQNQQGAVMPGILQGNQGGGGMPGIMQGQGGMPGMAGMGPAGFPMGMMGNALNSSMAMMMGFMGGPMGPAGMMMGPGGMQPGMNNMMMGPGGMQPGMNNMMMDMPSHQFNQN